MDVEVEEPEPQRFELAQYDALAEIQIALPSPVKVAKEAAEQFLLSLGNLSRPASFEIIGTKDAIIIQIACGERNRQHVRHELQAFFPDALLSERTGYLQDLWEETGRRGSVAVDFGPSHEFMRPLRWMSERQFKPRPPMSKRLRDE
jgi:hypothetical protein